MTIIADFLCFKSFQYVFPLDLFIFRTGHFIQKLLNKSVFFILSASKFKSKHSIIFDFMRSAIFIKVYLGDFFQFIHVISHLFIISILLALFLHFGSICPYFVNFVIA